MHLQNNTLLQEGKYKIVRFIASGGFGCTYEAQHTFLDSRVALKEFFISDFCNRDEITGQVTVATKSKVEFVDKLKKKFMDEARSLFKMKHPGIVRVIDVFEENGTAYYAMEYIDGESLGDLVKRKGKLPEAEVVGYIRQVAEALKYVHSLNRLHLDIKPGNIMLNKDGKAVLIDFGASKHYDDETGENTSTLLGINTKGYAPVEQVNQSFRSFSPATDIYALGATLYKLLTGVTPPPSPLLHSEEAPLAPLPSSISSRTRQAVKSAMQILRKNRPQSVEEWMTMLVDDEVTNVDPEPQPMPEPKSNPNPKPNPRPKPKPIPQSGPTKQSPLKWIILGVVAVVVVAILDIYYAPSDLLILLVGLVLFFSLIEFVDSLIGVKFQMSSFPWKKWTIETVPILLSIMVIAPFYFLFEQEMLDSDWVYVGSTVVCLGGLFLFRWIIGRILK